MSWLTNSLAMFTLNVGQRSMGLIGIVVLARVLDVRGLGAYTFTQSVAQSFSGWGRFGLDTGTHVSLAATVDRERAAAMISQSITLAAIIAAVVAAGLVAASEIIAGSLFAAPELAPFVAPAALTCAALMLFGVVYAVHAGLGTFQEYVRTAIAGAVISLALVTSGAFALGSIGAAWGLALGQITTTALTVFAMVRVLRARQIVLGLALPGRQAVEILKRGMPFFAGTLFVLPADFLTLTLLARTGGVDLLGELRVVQSIMSAASALPTAMMGPILTYLAAEYASGRGDWEVRRQLKLLWILALLIAAGLAGVWPLAVDVVAGGAFPEARRAGDLALIAFVPTMLLSVLHGALLARGNAGAQLLMVGAAQAWACVVAAYLLVPAYGLAGYLISQSFSFAVATGVAALTWGGIRQVGPRAVILMLLTLGLVAGLLFDLLAPQDVALRLAIATVGATVIASVVFATVLTAAERQQLIAALVGILRKLGRARADTSA